MNLNKKEILITGDCVLRDIQNKFTAFFPYLKIEFLQTTNLSKSARNIAIDPNTSLSNLINTNVLQKISIENNRTVAQLSNDFKSALGFTIEISRKSGKVWNVISLTDAWTLESQNSAAKFISLEMGAKPD